LRHADFTQRREGIARQAATKEFQQENGGNGEGKTVSKMRKSSSLSDLTRSFFPGFHTIRYFTRHDGGICFTDGCCFANIQV
jgi:hypothetical protein